LLVAEDNAVNQKVSVAMLEKIGYDADVVSNGLKAVDATAGHRYAALLMDCHMPEMDGYQATTAIRQREERTGAPRLPIIAMTAAAMEGEQAKCFAAGMDDYIAKPVRLDELMRVVSRWVTDGKSDAESIPFETITDQTSTAHLDPARIAELREVKDKSSGDAFVTLGEIFQEDAPPRLSSIRDAINDGDSAKVAWEAHALRGSAANLGASELARLCEKLEALGGEDVLGKLPDLLARLEAEYHAVVRELEAALQ
jgi:CheY-like chemotaxis protein/HPt (histidine-containing phosphotransfer) domain-containing protein